MKDSKEKNIIVCGKSSELTNEYSTYFNKNFNVDGSPTDYELENIFNAPQDNIEKIVGYSKYSYRKYGIIMRLLNMYRDFGATKIHFEYKEENEKAKEIIDAYNKQIKLNEIVRYMIFELAQTGNLVVYDRNGKRVDIYPIDMIEVLPLLINNKQILAYKIETDFSFVEYDKKIEDKIKKAYPKEILKGIKDNKDKVVLDPENSYFAKINCSQYEPYGLSVILPAFEDLAHKNLLKSAERATANAMIDKVILTKVGDKDNQPNDVMIEGYQNLLSNMSGSIALTVPYYVSMEYIEPETDVFGNDKFVEVDKDILNTLGVSVSLLRGEGGGSYSDGLVNFTGLCRSIESVREPIVDILRNLYIAELKRHNLDAKYAPTPKFGEVIIDKESRQGLIMELFQNASLPYEILYEEYDLNFDHIKLLKEKENEDNLDELFKLHSQPFQGGIESNDGDIQKEEPVDKGGAPKKTITGRKTDKSKSNNKQARPKKKEKTGVK